MTPPSQSDFLPRLVVGLVVFCVVPGVIGATLLGWGGLIIALAFPAVALALVALIAFGIFVEWIFGGSPKQHMERERETYRGL